MLKGFKLAAASILLSFNVLSVYIITPVVKAQSPTCSSNTSFLGIPAWYKYLEVVLSSNGKSCEVQLRGEKIEGTNMLKKALPNIAVAVLDALLRVAGLIAFIFVVLSGFRFVFAQGDPSKEKQARSALFDAVIGMLIAMFAAFIVGFIGNNLIK